MQAVRLARYHTGRRRIVRFCGAYHGWWGDVQPGIGNPVPARDTYTLADMSERTLQVLAHAARHRLRAGQSASGACTPMPARRPIPRWSTARAGRTSIGPPIPTGCGSCERSAARRGIVLILDEVFLGFRLAPGGAQEYFGVRADMVTYGKTLGGGLPVGVLCGRADLMRRFRDDRPVDICFARGTFNAHPYVMAAMSAFLDRSTAPEIARALPTISTRPGTRGRRGSTRSSRRHGLPVRVGQHVDDLDRPATREPSRYNWMLQFYLRAEGLALSWVGTGRLIFSLDLRRCRLRGGRGALRRRGRRDAARTAGGRAVPASDRAIRRRILREVMAVRLGSLGSRLGLRAPEGAEPAIRDAAGGRGVPRGESRSATPASHPSGAMLVRLALARSSSPLQQGSGALW